MRTHQRRFFKSAFRLASVVAMAALVREQDGKVERRKTWSKETRLLLIEGLLNEAGGLGAACLLSFKV